MTKEELIKLREQISQLSNDELKQRDLYLRSLANGEFQGPPVGYPSIDKMWLRYYKIEDIICDIPSCSAYSFLFEKSKMHLDKNALSYFGRKITFREMFGNIDKVADSLMSMGVKEGDIVSMSMPSIPEAVYLFYAISKIGAVANMIDPRSSEEGINDYINETKSSILFAIDVMNSKIKNIKNNSTINTVVDVSPFESLPTPLNSIMKLKASSKVNKSKGEGFIQWTSFCDLKDKHRRISDFKCDDGNKPVLIVHTGGTTGSPKGVILSNNNVNAIPFLSMQFPTDLQSKHKWLNIMPPFIAYGIGTGLHFPLSVGMEDILIPSFNPAEFDKLINKHKPNHISGVPSHWNNIIYSKLLKNKDLSYLITCAVGGDTMNYELERKSNIFLHEHGCNYSISKGYGMTESNGSIGRTLNDNNPIGSVGIPFTKVNIKVCDPDTGEELGVEEKGEIYISGPTLMIGYYNNEKETNNVISNEFNVRWLRTGDFGYISKDGNLFILDRIKRIIIRHDGFKVFPNLIEEVIEKHPNVKECKVVGMPDIENVQGMLPCAYIVMEDENVDLEQFKSEIINMCKQKLPEYSQPQLIKIKKVLPLTLIGKVDTLSLMKEVADEVEVSGKNKVLVK